MASFFLNFAPKTDNRLVKVSAKSAEKNSFKNVDGWNVLKSSATHSHPLFVTCYEAVLCEFGFDQKRP